MAVSIRAFLRTFAILSGTGPLFAKLVTVRLPNCRCCAVSVTHVKTTKTNFLMARGTFLQSSAKEATNDRHDWGLTRTERPQTLFYFINLYLIDNYP
ncbi:hypothetical protein Y032_0401g789 [Ancylostoma ceylanicum]|uniref:Secreted protein n=1 Tax=Ancylostoma ceylanicum TaxID=53326 RepID=A0A016X2M6_9BILA|nr:hypothetical protein Y032_0401g789 [Ancylostoma ceylanicum]